MHSVILETNSPLASFPFAGSDANWRSLRSKLLPNSLAASHCRQLIGSSIPGRLRLIGIVLVAFSIGACSIRNSFAASDGRDNRSDPAKQTQGNPKRIGTNLTAFGIPFAIQDPENKFIEVQLYMSKTRGLSWQFYARQELNAREIPFQSTGDGEYWFALKTLDRNRQLQPLGETRPELVVVVDTVLPILDFRVQTDAAGRVVCRWDAKDQYIDPNSVRLSYRPLISANDVENKWINVSYKAVEIAQNGSFSDQYAFWADCPSPEMIVRFEVADFGGNVATAERQIVAPRVTQINGGWNVRRESKQINQPAPAQLAATGAQSNLQSSNYNQPPTHLPVTSSSTTNSQSSSLYGRSSGENGSNDRDDLKLQESSSTVTWQSRPSSGDGRNAAQTESWPVQKTNTPLMTLDEATTAKSETTKDNPANSAEASNSVNHGDKSYRVVNDPSPDESRPEPMLPLVTDNNSSQESPQLLTPPPAKHDSNFALQTSSEQSVLANPSKQTVAQATPLIKDREANLNSINSKLFRLNYDNNLLDPALVRKVTLWMTTDGGQTWTAYGDDADRISPFPVQVESEGVYGFRIVIESNDGVVGRSPARGDEADSWIRVDLTPPDVQLLSAPFGRDRDAGSLVINWRASDDDLGEQPISLSYSTAADGPWTIIVERHANTGSFAWRAGREIPDKVYLKLDVSDAAGNSASTSTTRPIDLTGIIPRGRILSVDPVK